MQYDNTDINIKSRKNVFKAILIRIKISVKEKSTIVYSDISIDNLLFNY